MGGAVSSGRDNNELVDNLMSGNYIRSRAVEQVFRVLDRADYMSPESRDQAYRDLAWRNGPLHLSAPCIYSEVMEALDLKPGLSFLNVGSGTGYLSTLVGLIIGSSGISHGVETISFVLDYANKKLLQFIDNSATLDELDFCTPKYYSGNGLCLAPSQLYDRVYCGAGVQAKYENYFKQLIKVGGVLVMPLAETLVQFRRVSETHWSRRNLLNVSFALLREPLHDQRQDLIKLEEQRPVSLQALCRGAIRGAMRAGLARRHPELRAPPAPPPRAPPPPRRIRIPCGPTSDEELNELHDLDEAGGANEMNALLSLVLSMGQNRAAGSLRLDPGDDDEYAAVGELYALGERRRAADDDGVIVFDVAAGGMRARRWLPRRFRRRLPLPADRDRDEAQRARGRSEEAGTSRSAARRGSTSESERSESPSLGSDVRSDDSASDSDARAHSPRPRISHHRRASWTDLSSDDEDVTQAQEVKRQKLDSGIGEGTLSSGASPDTSADTSAPPAPRSPRTPPPHHGVQEQDAEMPWYDLDPITSESSEAESDSEAEAGEADRAGDVPLPPPPAPAAPPADQNSPDDNTGGAETSATKTSKPRPERRRRGALAPRVRRAARARAPDGSARRARLSLAMKRGVKELPLPHALKSYINYGRCYQI